MTFLKPTRLLWYSALCASFILPGMFGCTKNHHENKLPELFSISPGLKADFSYRVGSYWIYKDSLTGETDSAYVASYYESFVPTGCTSGSKREHVSMTIMHRRWSAAGDIIEDGSSWIIGLQDNIITMGFKDATDSVASEQNLTLATYPFEPCYLTSPRAGCLLFGIQDSGYVTEVIPFANISRSSFPNIAVSMHMNKNKGFLLYQDVMYLSSQGGIVKFVMAHPGKHRVLELQTYYQVK